MAEPARSFNQPHERVTQLHRVGISEETIKTAVLRGFVARSSCTPFDPPSYPGTVQWAQTHRALRMLAVAQDWTPTDAHNYSRIISPDSKIAITVATGDENTGIEGEAEPRTKYKKGTETTLAVETNVKLDEQLTLWPVPRVVREQDPTISEQTLWIVLITTTEDEIRYELSRPKGQDEQGRVVSWYDRIIFDPIEIESIPSGKNDDDDDDGDAGIYVPVERI
jgi:hypothetical protein